MLPIAFLLASHRPESPYIVAAHIRFYYRDNRKSHFGLYLIKADGTRRHFNIGNDAYSPVWLDCDHVAWLEPRKRTSELWMLALPSFERRRVLVGKKIDLWDGGIVEADGKTYRVSPRGLKGITKPPVEPDADTLAISADNSAVTWQGRKYRLENPKVQWHTSDVEEEEVTLDGVGHETAGTTSIRKGDQIFVAGSFGYTAHVGSVILFRFDTKRQTARILPQDAAWIHFDPKGERFLAYSNRRLSPLGDMFVWASKIYLGTLPSGKYKEITLPISFTLDAQLRP